jgi:hypothetical protein
MCAMGDHSRAQTYIKKGKQRIPAERMEDEVVISKFPKIFKNKFSTNTKDWGMPFHTSVPRGTLSSSNLSSVYIS